MPDRLFSNPPSLTLPGMDTLYHREEHFRGGETVKDIVIGMSDGLTVPFALAAGISGAISAAHIVVTAGFAEIAAGSIAMGLGGYPDLLKEAASQAARVLAIRRRIALRPSGPDQRRWTGVVFGRRAWVGQPVVLPDKTVGWIKQAQAGLVCVRTCAFKPEIGAVHDYLAAGELQPYRLPEAVLLGSLKKGAKEQKSAVKAASSRRNGSAPVKPGSRQRGRPNRSPSSIPAEGLFGGA